MNPLDVLEQAATEVVEAGGLHWKVSRVHTRVTSSVDRYRLVALARPQGEDAAMEQATRDLPPEQRFKEAMRMHLARLAEALSPEEVEESHRIRLSIVTAGTKAVSADGTDWQPVCIVDFDEPVDRQVSPPKIPLSMLPAGVMDALYEAIWRLSANKGADAERIARFRGAGGS